MRLLWGPVLALLAAPAQAQQIAPVEPPRTILNALASTGPLDLVRSWPLEANGDGRADYLVQAARPIGAGNAVTLSFALYLSTRGGGYAVTPLQGLDGGIRDVALGPVGLDVTLYVMRPNDPRCCPSGTRRLSLDLRQLRN